METFNSIGKVRRLNKLFATDINGIKRTLIVPIDDSLIDGPLKGLHDIHGTLQQILEAKPNAIMGFKNALNISTKIDTNIPFIYNLTASSTLGQHTKKVVVGDVEQLLTAGVDCIAVHINFTSEYTSDMLRNFSYISNACDKVGMPCLAIVYPRSERKDGGDENYEDLKTNERDKYTSFISHATRIVVELGADIVKTCYTGNGETFKSVVAAAAGKHVIVAGGQQTDIHTSLKTVAEIITAGASGICFGRNIFNAKDIKAYIEMAKSIIFKNEEMDYVIKTNNK